MSLNKVIVGMDIGGTKTAVSLFSNEGSELLFTYKEPTPLVDDPEKFFEFLCGLIFKCFRRCGISINLLEGIGVGVPSAVDTNSGEILYTPNIPVLHDFNLLYNFRDYFVVRTIIDNDANCAALAEYKFGAGKGCSNMAYITLSTGIGSGIILDGKLFRGSHGYSGEVGHINMDMNSEDACGCGNKGCAEAIASGASLDAKIKKEIAKGKKTSIKTFPVTGEVLKRAYDEGDELAIHIFNTLADVAGILLYDINCILDLERFVIGGGLTNLGDAYLERIRESFLKYSKINVDILKAKLDDKRGTLGAAQLLFN